MLIADIPARRSHRIAHHVQLECRKRGKVPLIGLLGREAYGKGGGLRAVVHAQLGEQG